MSHILSNHMYDEMKRRGIPPAGVELAPAADYAVIA
jgi:hypothetical protein